VTEEQKRKLEELKVKLESDRSDAEKIEMGLLETIEKQAVQIAEKDSLIGTKGTEIDTLKKSIESKTGAEKEALKEQLAAKEEALETMKAGLDALKEAQKINASTISPTKPGYGDTVDPKEVIELEKRAYSDPLVKEEVEKQIEELDEEDWEAFQSDPKFKMLILQKALGSGSDKTKRSPWGNEVRKDKERSAETPEQRMERLFDKEKGNHRRLPPNSSGRGGRGGRGIPGMPKAKERPVDTRTQ